MNIENIDIFTILLSREIQQKILPLKIIFIAISVFLFGWVVFLLKNTSWFKYYFALDLLEFLSYKPHQKIGLVKRWEKIKKRLERGWEAEAKLAIIEADKLLDDVLKLMGYGGTDIESRLKKLTTDKVTNLDALLKAHEIRNSIVHDPDYHLLLEKAEEVILTYEQTFKHLGLF